MPNLKQWPDRPGRFGAGALRLKITYSLGHDRLFGVDQMRYDEPGFRNDPTPVAIAQQRFRQKVATTFFRLR